VRELGAHQRRDAVAAVLGAGRGIFASTGGMRFSTFDAVDGANA
jgi:hypothetical protein